MSLPLLKIAVVGHTNTGKTSLIRTLLRDTRFGEVRDEPGTTRQVERVLLQIEGVPAIELSDSPGLESASDLIGALAALSTARHDGPERIRRLLADAAIRAEFPQEVAVLALMLETDVGLYVIDAREPVLAKYLDELEILAACARPIVPLLNFLAQPESRRAAWLEGLARVGLHVVVELDAVVRDPQSELRLFDVLRVQLHGFAATLEAWIRKRRQEEALRLRGACRLAAGLLLDAAAWRIRAARDDPGAEAAALETARRVLREREERCTRELLELYRFGYGEYGDEALRLERTRRSDRLDVHALRHHAQQAGGYLAAGAGIGATIDLATLGLSLGAGTALGSAVGATIGLVRSYRAWLLDRLGGYRSLQVDEADLQRLASRQVALIRALVIRGHGSQAPIRTGAALDSLDPGGLPGLLRRCRHDPRLSTLNGPAVDELVRERRLEELRRALYRELTGAA